ncbi:hypothetical protein EB061_12285 [bacterium]|nr:hypothetical protein [bacterium]
MALPRILVLIGFGFLALMVHRAQAGEIILQESELLPLQEMARTLPYRKRWSLDDSGLVSYEIGSPG